MKTCIVCGQEFALLPTQNPNRKTCSHECFVVLMKQEQTGDNNSCWKGGYSQPSYQRRRREMKPDVCETCGAVPPTRLDTHHLDRDHTNNTFENLIVLCVNCHAKVHYIEDDRGLNGRK